MSRSEGVTENAGVENVIQLKLHDGFPYVIAPVFPLPHFLRLPLREEVAVNQGYLWRAGGVSLSL